MSTAVQLNITINYNVLLGPNVITEEQRNVSSELNVSRLSAEPPAVRKDFLSLSPLAFTQSLPVVRASKLTARTGCLEIHFGMRVDKFMIPFW
jgi:hypothetical protein